MCLECRIGLGGKLKQLVDKIGCPDDTEIFRQIQFSDGVLSW